MITVSRVGRYLRIVLNHPGIDEAGHTLVLALATGHQGCAVVPFEQSQEGSTVFLPFRADRIYATASGGNGVANTMRRWSGTMWQDRETAESEFSIQRLPGELRAAIE